MATVLYADDVLKKESTKQEYERMFSRRGHTLLTATDGEEALELICQKSIDLIFLDLNMPTLNGLQVLEELKTKGMSIPVVICSSNTRKEELVREVGYDCIVGYCRTISGNEILRYLDESSD